jgi:tRNA threonylcarbamoyladenosine biosynthesis protein TsaE
MVSSGLTVIASQVYDLELMQKIAYEHLLPLWKSGTIFALRGEIGAGKTTLVKEFLAACGVVGEVISPTYSYFCQYAASNDIQVYHFDLYRVGSVEAFFQLGFDEILFDSANCVILEWPEVVESLLLGDAMRSRVVWIDILYDLKNAQERRLIISKSI